MHVFLVRLLLNGGEICVSSLAGYHPESLLVVFPSCFEIKISPRLKFLDGW